MVTGSSQEHSGRTVRVQPGPRSHQRPSGLLLSEEPMGRRLVRGGLLPHAVPLSRPRILPGLCPARYVVMVGQTTRHRPGRLAILWARRRHLWTTHRAAVGPRETSDRQDKGWFHPLRSVSTPRVESTTYMIFRRRPRNEGFCYYSRDARLLFNRRVGGRPLSATDGLPAVN